MPTDRFAVLTDTAIDVLADLGMRGLTHRAVDTRAGLPQGTTSAYLRTRKALIEAVVRRIADLDRADANRADLDRADLDRADANRADANRVGLDGGRLSKVADPLPAGAGGPHDVDAVAAGIALVLDRWTSTARNRTLARYACLLEATHHPELRVPGPGPGAARRPRLRRPRTRRRPPRGLHRRPAVRPAGRGGFRSGAAARHGREPRRSGYRDRGAAEGLRRAVNRARRAGSVAGGLSRRAQSAGSVGGLSRRWRRRCARGAGRRDRCAGRTPRSGAGRPSGRSGCPGG
jgi:AcrR family transcriptional regulator